MRWRLAIFASVSTVALLALHLWPMPDDPSYSYEVSFWAGPILLLSMPATLGWVSFGAQSQRAAAVGFAATMVLLGICLLFMWSAHENHCASVLTAPRCYQ